MAALEGSPETPTPPKTADELRQEVLADKEWPAKWNKVVITPAVPVKFGNVEPALMKVGSAGQRVNPKVTVHYTG